MSTSEASPPGDYTIACSHDGWNNIGAGTWWTFNITVGNERSSTITGSASSTSADLTGNGVYVTVTAPGGGTVTSN